MSNRYIRAALGLLIGSLTIYGVASAHGMEKHGNTMASDYARMQKLHAMMPMFSQASAQLAAALKKGDVRSAEWEAERIIAAIPDLKRSKPHKHATELTKYIQRATNLEIAVRSTREMAQKGNFGEATKAYRKIEAACTACHTRFRD